MWRKGKYILVVEVQTQKMRGLWKRMIVNGKYSKISPMCLVGGAHGAPRWSSTSWSSVEQKENIFSLTQGFERTFNNRKKCWKTLYLN